MSAFYARAEQPSSGIASVVSQVQSSVVRIVVVHRSDASQPNQSLAQQNGGTPLTTIGSGFAVDPGLIATNRHVVDNAVSIFIETLDGGRFRASIVGSAAKADIALLRISPDARLPVLSFGDSDRLQVGDTVIAIGSPFGFDNSVSAGIVSSVNRNIMESPFDDYIQTDAAINHGNSGGPLFNMQGQVVGMTSVLFAPGNYSGSSGVGFAIPSSVLRFVVDNLAKYGVDRIGMLPLRTQQVTALMAEAIGSPSAGGAIVVRLEQQGDQMNGAIKRGDIIRTFNGEAVTDPRDLNRLAAMATIGSIAHLEMFREGKMMAVDVRVLPYDQADKPLAQTDAPPHTLGLHFEAAGGGQQGVVVSAVDRSGSAADSGLKPGDILLAVQEQTVTSPDQAMQALQARIEAGQHYAALLVERDDKQSWVPVGLPK